jgi:hypothetical protein
MDMFRYGVFSLGQIWTLTDPTGAKLGFSSREVALAALQTVVAVHRASGDSVLVTVQDEAGRLRTLLNPTESLTLHKLSRDAEWDVLLGVTTRKVLSRFGGPQPGMVSA